MANITLGTGVRQNLQALQQTSDLMSITQNRLATGKKVNTALDNANSFFTASSLNDRANDLSSLLDDQGQAIQTLKAADQGITAITKLVEAAKAKAVRRCRARRPPTAASSPANTTICSARSKASRTTRATRARTSSRATTSRSRSTRSPAAIRTS